MKVAFLLLMAAAVTAKPPLPWLGLAFTWSETATETHMLHVRSVTPDGPAQHAGIRAGDFVATINGERVDFGDEVEFLMFLLERKPGERLRLGLVREGQIVPVQVTLGELPDERRAKWEQNLEMARRQRAARAVQQP